MKKSNRILSLLTAAMILPASLWAATISGTITTGSGATALVGAKVVLIAANVRTDSTVTDSVGHYTLLNVATGTKTIEGSYTGLSTTTANSNINNANQNATVNLDLGVPGTITGTVRRASDSTVIAGSWVYLRRSSATGTLIDSVLTGGGGTFAFNNVASGTPNYWVIATAVGFSNATLANIALSSGSSVSFNLYMTLPANITGTVRSAADSVTPLANVLVVLRRGSATATILDSVLTNGSGVYVFNNVASGLPNYWVIASGTGYITGTTANVVVTSGGITTTNIYLVPIVAATISGTVTGTPGGAPIANALVVLRRTSATSAILDSVHTNGAGFYSFSNVAPLAPNYWITASATGFITATNTNVAVPNGGAVVSNFALVARGTITGLLINEPLPDLPYAIRGAWVYLRHGSDTAAIMDSVQSDSVTGRYTFSNLVADTLNYWVTAITNVGTATNAAIVVVSGGVTASDFHFTPAAIQAGFAKSNGIHFTRMGGQLIMNLGASNVARTVQVFGPNGALQSRISVRVGESNVVVPAAFSKGYLFKLK